MVVRAVFVSDLHLWNLGDERAQVFLRLLRQLEDEEDLTHLFLVGDIFDLWIGGHQVFKEQFSEVLKSIQVLSRRGVRVHYFEGNHDLHLAPFWTVNYGVSVHPGPEVFEWSGFRVRIEHGDQIDPDDRGYIFLRWFLRTPLVRWLALRLPGRWVKKIGERASQKSRRYTSETKTLSEDEVKKFLHRHAKQMAENQSINLLIHGHVHVFDDYHFKLSSRKVRSINLGSWLKRPYRFLDVMVESGTNKKEDGSFPDIKISVREMSP